MTKSRKLTEEEQKLWRDFTKNIKPLKKRSPPAKPTQEETISKTNNPSPNVVQKQSVNKLKPNSNAQIDARKARIIKKKGLDIEAQTDLHGLTQERAYQRLSRFIEENWQQGVRNLLIVTGKGKGYDGTGVLREMLPLWLSEDKFKRMILHITPANQKDGGDGAYYVVLRRNRN